MAWENQSMGVRNYRDLIAWQKAMDLAEQVYAVSGQFPADEKFGLTSQLRRSIISVPSNIAEGEGRNSPGDFRRFLFIAHGSLREAETQVLLAKRLGYCQPDQADATLANAAEVGRLIRGLVRSIDSQ